MTAESEGQDECEDLPKSLRSALGLPEPQFQDESLAPELDRELLIRLARRELPEKYARLAYRLIHSFASWRNCYADLVAEEFRSKQGKP